MSYPFLGIMGMANKAWHHQKYAVVSSGAAVAAFLQYVTTGSTSSFTLLSSGTVDYEVDWGDGTTESLTSNNPTHAYSSAGEYTIKVTPAEGSTYRPDFDDLVSDTSIASVSGTGGSQLGTTLQNAWAGANQITSFGSNVDTSSVTNFNQTWRALMSLTSFPQLDTSSGTSFYNSWAQCTTLTSFPQLDTSSGTYFYGAWSGCANLTSFPQLNVSSGLNFSNTWNGCGNLTSFPSLDFSSGTDFSYTWYNNSSLTSFPQLDVSSGTNFINTWRNCSSLTSFPLLDTSSGTIFSGAWNGCTGLTSFPLLNTSSGTAFNNAWRNCSSLTSFPLLDTSSSTYFGSAWNGCTGLTSFPQLDVSSGTGFDFAWYNCSSLTTFPANMFDTTGTLTSIAFDAAWTSSSLSAQSIENILTSLDTNGASGITLGINGGNNAAKTTWSAAANTAYTNLIGKSWTISYNA